jgi:hypothetical protein
MMVVVGISLILWLLHSVDDVDRSYNNNNMKRRIDGGGLLNDLWFYDYNHRCKSYTIDGSSAYFLNNNSNDDSNNSKHPQAHTPKGLPMLRVLLYTKRLPVSVSFSVFCFVCYDYELLLQLTVLSTNIKQREECVCCVYSTTGMLAVLAVCVMIFFLNFQVSIDNLFLVLSFYSEAFL